MRYFYGLAVVLVMVCAGTSVFAEDTPKSGVVTVDLFDLALGVTNAEYEMTLDNSASSLSFRGGSGGQDLGDWSWSIITLGSSYRGYFGGKAPSGGYWGAGLDLWQIDAEQTTLGVTAQGDGTFFGPKLEIGYQSVSDAGLTFSIGLGLTYLSGDLTVNNEEFPMSGMGADIRLALGYGW